MTLELNCVLLRGEELTLSMLAREGQLTCLTGGTASRRTRWLHAMMGFETPVTGYISLDGEPLSAEAIGGLRQFMAFVPSGLSAVGSIVVYEPPTAADMLSLRSNRHLGVSATDIEEECRRTGTTGDKARLLAAAVLRRKPVLLVDSPSGASANYLHSLAAQGGATVIAATDDALVIGRADNIVELPTPNP